MREVKIEMKNALFGFLDSGELSFPYELGLNESIEFTIYASQPIGGRVFRSAGGIDRNAGGWVIPVYKENLQLCVKEKSSKVAQFLPRYNQWWLFLVDHMGWGLDAKETKDLIDSVADLGNFDRVVILSNDGQRLLASTPQ